ncbi:MAG: sugar phosphate isomerase/epimerase [Planctomycetes bacterium]|nr:sugar phosphate isomerase/epimerase [Planctomycetota bacterium]
MSDRRQTRRRFLKHAAWAAGSAVLVGGSTRLGIAADRAKLHLACNHYPWIVFYRRENQDFNASLDSGLGEVAASGMDGFEPIVNEPDEIDRLAPLLKKHGLEMRSLYVNSVLHDSAEAEKSLAQVLAIAEKAKAVGTRIIVTNPSPIRWGGEENKDDAQLRVQARSLDTLGARLRSMGLVLSYHNHDIELRNAAREFHHMMLGTDPEHVTLCLDAHWIYRGAGNSSVALFDVVKLYGSRVTELHLRQSAENVWTEALSEGDIDYPALAERLPTLGVKPHLVIEQAVEKETPKTIDAVESHRRSREYVDRVFARFAG